MYVSSRQGQCLTYDAVSNVLSVVNGASVPQSGKAGGLMYNKNHAKYNQKYGVK